MKHLLSQFIIIFIFGFKIGYAIQPDSIVIYDNTDAFLNSYHYKYLIVNKANKFVLYQNYKYVRDNKGEKKSSLIKRMKSISIDNITSLVNAIKDSSYPKLQLQNFGYDKDWILSNSDKLFSYVEANCDNWTPQKIFFVKKQLSDVDNFQQALKKVIVIDGFGSIDQGIDFKAIFYYKNLSPITIEASENSMGMPWKVDSIHSFNPAIPKLFSQILPNNSSYNKRRFSRFKFLMQELANQVYQDTCKQKMSELSILEFTKEIDELKAKYTILTSTEYPYGDGYIWEDKQVLKFELHDSLMMANLNIDLYLTREKNTLYSRDSILNKGSELVQTVQDIPFIRNFLLADTSRKLKINFENGASINGKVIDGFNKTEKEWKSYDAYVQQWHWMDSMKIGSKTNEAEALDVAREVDCGCNFRLDNNFLRRGIYFVIYDKKKGDWSYWIILPDSSIILWWIQGEGFSNYNYTDLGVNRGGVQYVCRKFNRNGEIIADKR